MRQQTLHALLGVSKTECKDDTFIDVYDLFCGAGGFSCGAEMAGCKVVFACDCDEQALETHALNHPDAVHVCGSLPDVSILPIPSNRQTHMHGSPPCQMFSTVRAEATDSREDDKRVHNARSLVEWYLEYAIASGAATWSMEHVASAEVINIVKRVQRKHANTMAYAIVNLSYLGVPQTRKRLVAGTHTLISRIVQAQCKANQRSVRDVITTPRGTHIRNSKSWISSSCKSVKKQARGVAPPYPVRRRTRCDAQTQVKAGLHDNLRCISKPAPTVLTNGDLRWVEPLTSHRGLRLTMRELATLQTFPVSYSLPFKKQPALKQIGNAVPPLLAKVLMDAVVHICKTDTSCQRDCA